MGTCLAAGIDPSDLVKAGVNSLSHTPLMLHKKINKVAGRWKTQQHTGQFWDEATPDLSTLFTLMKKQGTILDATLLTYKKWGDTDSTMRYDYEIGRRITDAAYRAGVAICAGTDE